MIQAGRNGQGIRHTRGLQEINAAGPEKSLSIFTFNLACPKKDIYLPL